MNTFAIVAFFAALAATYAAPSATIVQGPSARSTVVGVDGSVISSVAPGGQIIAEEHPGFVAHAAPAVYSSYAHAPVVSAYSSPVVAAHSAYSAPVVAAHSSYSAPVFAAHTAYAAHAPVVSAYASPVAAHGLIGHSALDTIVAGPSGTIATSKTVASPAVVAAYGVHGYGAHGLHGLYY